MTMLGEPPGGSDGATRTAPSDAQDAVVPARADGVQLIGELKGSGYRVPPALARRGDGQTIQLTPLLYLVLAALDGVKTHEQVASEVSQAFGKTVSADNIRTLVEQLRPTGLVVDADGAEPQVQKSNPLLALRFKYAVTDPERTRRLTAPFGWLFNPLVVVLVLAALLAVSWWVLFEKGLASATHEAFDKPGLLLLVVAVTVLSAGFHEFGHAAAARRGGATPGVMGAGVYLVWPAFYTDVTDSYRLGRRGRVLTDLGGLYFNAIVAVAIAGVWWVTQYDALLLVIATQILQMLHQLTPLVRFDGYHVLADVTGVPDLFQRIKPTLLGLLPWRWRHPETTILKPWARAVVTTWVLVVVPMLAFSMFCMVLTLPRIVGTAWTSAGRQGTMLGRAWGDADVLEVLARGLAIVAVLFPVLAVAVILFRLVRRILTRVWTGTSGRPVARVLAGVLALALVAGLGFLWWPREGAYRPIQPYEGGTLTQVASVARPPTSALRVGSRGRIVTGWSRGDARPTREKPQLALVLVPRKGSSATSGKDTGKGGAGATPESWVFPFNKPLKPGKGDNQALAVNTKDNTIRYDVAFALVWVEDGSPALNKNEAYAFASCNNCAAVAVGFQIVLVTGENHVAVPQNISAAVNSDCVNCLTYALATQLFVTLDGPLSKASNKELAALWREIATFGANIASVPLNEIRDRLTAYEGKILDIVKADQQGDSSVQAGDSGSKDAPADQASTAPDPAPSQAADDNPPAGDGTGTSGSGQTQQENGGDTSSGTSTQDGTGGTTDPTAPAGESPAAEPSAAP